MEFILIGQILFCHGQLYICFPCHKEDIRKFLYLFTDAFAFSTKQKLRFEPEDKVMDIYKTLYPSNKWMADALEVETLAMDVEREYNVNFSSLWHEDLTLGELFAKVQNT